MKTVEKKSLNKPDETFSFPKAKIEVVTLGGITYKRMTLEPGWKWSESVKPVAKTESCPVQHNAYFIKGRLRVRMDDGTEEEYGPGDVEVIAPGHDAWVVGKETVVLIDIAGVKS